MAIRLPWLVFGTLLTCAIIAFGARVDWVSQAWLDLADYAVSVIATVGVLLYAFGREPSGAAFWRVFRWVFVGVASAQATVHAVQVAKQHGYSVAGTVAFLLVVAVVMGWIFAFQWIAMTRLAKAS
jgi:hypothetical protein